MWSAGRPESGVCGVVAPDMTGAALQANVNGLPVNTIPRVNIQQMNAMPPTRAKQL
jgi:hypothetical protein